MRLDAQIQMNVTEYAIRNQDVQTMHMLSWCSSLCLLDCEVNF